MHENHLGRACRALRIVDAVLPGQALDPHDLEDEDCTAERPIQNDLVKTTGIRLTLAATLTLTGVLLAACAPDAGGPGWTATVDTVSSTVRVANTPPAAGAAPTLMAEEELRIGTVDGTGPASFGLVRSLAVLPDGRVAVADAQAEEVRLFDASGRHLRTFGGEGAGPGELRGTQGVHLDHRGLLRVAEQRNARLSVFHPDTGFVTSYPLQLFSFSFRGPWEAAVDAGGRTFVMSSGQYGEGRFWDMLRVYDTAMIQVDSVPYHDYTDAALEGDPEGAWRIELARGMTFGPVPFYAREHRVLAPTGEIWSSAPGAARLEVARWRPPADTSLVVVSGREPEAVTAAERDSAMAELRARLIERAPDLRTLDPGRVPDTKPPLYALSLDGSGRLWARISDPTADSTVYDVFGRDGRHAETVVRPFRVDAWIPPVVREDAVWSVVTDELDVQHVVRARLREADEG